MTSLSGLSRYINHILQKDSMLTSLEIEKPVVCVKMMDQMIIVPSHLHGKKLTEQEWIVVHTLCLMNTLFIWSPVKESSPHPVMKQEDWKAYVAVRIAFWDFAEKTVDTFGLKGDERIEKRDRLSDDTFRSHFIKAMTTLQTGSPRSLRRLSVLTPLLMAKYQSL